MNELEKEVREKITVWIKAGKNRKEIEKKIRAAYTKEAAFKYGKKYSKEKFIEVGLKVYEELMKKENGKRKKKKRKPLKKSTVKKILAINFFALIFLVLVVYFVFFHNSFYFTNSCSNEAIRISINGPMDFRAKMVESLEFLRKNNCAYFLFVAKRVKKIKFREMKNAVVEPGEELFLVGATPREDYWYAAFFVYGACAIQALNEGKDMGKSETQKQCFLLSAKATRELGASETEYALWLENKEFQENWKEFWVSSK